MYVITDLKWFHHSSFHSMSSVQDSLLLMFLVSKVHALITSSLKPTHSHTHTHFHVVLWLCQGCQAELFWTFSLEGKGSVCCVFFPCSIRHDELL